MKYDNGIDIVLDSARWPGYIGSMVSCLWQQTVPESPVCEGDHDLAALSGMRWEGLLRPTASSWITLPYIRSMDSDDSRCGVKKAARGNKGAGRLS